MGTTTVLHRGELVVTSRWLCPASSARWHERSTTGEDGYLVALAHRPVGIRHAGRQAVWADHGAAVLYDPEQEYDRKLLHPDGDVADILGFCPSLVAEAVGPSFRASAVPVSDSAFLQQRQAFLMRDPFALDEAAFAVLADVAAALGRPAAPAGPLVDRARRLLGEDLGEPLSLAETARRAHVSPYHLARVFKAATGSTLHGYREGLRLRAAADRAIAGHRLADVAADLGLASHSHLSARFRRRFGIAPSALA
ncbi:MAG: helix-turn-helix-domain containing protein AraC type [Frankiales bacterium]|nr:helix-turn-helix-domain containing protein AraC type [Frankiales bacterium]